MKHECFDYQNLFMYYFTNCTEAATFDFVNNIGVMFIDHQYFITEFMEEFWDYYEYY